MKEKSNMFPLEINMLEYNFETLLNKARTRYNIMFPNIIDAYKKTYISLRSKNVNFESSLGNLILNKLSEKMKYSYDLLKQALLEDTNDFPIYKIKIYLLIYTYVDFYDIEENLKTLMYEKYAGSSNYGYEPNYYIKMHMQDILELEKMNLLDSFYEIELGIMDMICTNEQKNINYMNEIKKLTRDS